MAGPAPVGYGYHRHAHSARHQFGHRGDLRFARRALITFARRAGSAARAPAGAGCRPRLVPLNCSGADNNQVARVRASPFLVSFWDTIEPKHTTMWFRAVHHCKVPPDFTLSIGELMEDLTMQRLIHLVGAASLVILAAAPAHAQGAPQTVTLMKVDPQSLATGYRTSKVVGSTVVNE